MKTFAGKTKKSAHPILRRRSAVLPVFNSTAQRQSARIRQVLRSPRIQPKLAISRPNDKYEQEADRVADAVMQMPDPAVQRQVALEEEKDDEQIRPKFKGNASHVPANFGSRMQALGSGRPLPRQTRNFFEPRFGRDFSRVRLHTGASAHQLAGSINARAFTRGNDIVFGGGEYNPESFSGKKLLGHELVHVVQQSLSHNRVSISNRYFVNSLITKNSSLMLMTVELGNPLMRVINKEKDENKHLTEVVNRLADNFHLSKGIISKLIEDFGNPVSWTPSLWSILSFFFQKLDIMSEPLGLLGLFVFLLQAPLLGINAALEGATQGIGIKALAYGVTSWVFYPQILRLPKRLPAVDKKALRSNVFNMSMSKYILKVAEEIWTKNWDEATLLMIRWSVSRLQELGDLSPPEVKTLNEVLKISIREKFESDPNEFSKKLFDGLVDKLKNYTPPHIIESIKLMRKSFNYPD